MAEDISPKAALQPLAQACSNAGTVDGARQALKAAAQQLRAQATADRQAARTQLSRTWGFAAIVARLHLAMADHGALRLDAVAGKFEEAAQQRADELKRHKQMAETLLGDLERRLDEAGKGVLGWLRR